MKKVTFTILSLLFLTVSFIGCTAATYEAPKEKVFDKEITVNKSYDDTWQKAIDWFATHNSPIKTMDKNSGIIATDYNLTVSDYRRYSDCGRYKDGDRIIGEYANPIGNFNMLIKKIDDNSSKVTINCFFNVTLNQYRTNFLDSKTELLASDKVECKSNGQLEKEIFTALK